MRCVVVGAGAWGLPAAAVLATRGHRVELVDRHGPANPLSSSPGPTRLWRLSHPDPVRVRLALRSVAAMQRLARRSGRTVHLRRGLLWRDDDSLQLVAAALRAEGVEFDEIAATEVGAVFPGLRADDRDAVWQADAGPVLAAASMAAQLELFLGAGGTVTTSHVVQVDSDPSGSVLRCSDGTRLHADRVVIAPGPGVGALLPELGVDLPFRPRLEQVVHLGDPGDRSATDDLPCLFDGPAGDEPALYSMPTPGAGYKVGLDLALRDLFDGDDDRTPDTVMVEHARRRVERDLGSVPATVLDAQVCSWTESPDNRFVIDVLSDGTVIACGDGGEGFKFSALMGEILADLAEGRAADEDVSTFSLARFADGVPTEPHVLGR